MIGEQKKMLDYNNYYDIIKCHITNDDSRYLQPWDFEKISMYLRSRCIVIREKQIPTYKISKAFSEKFKINRPRGYFSENILYHFLKNGYKLIGFEMHYVDMIMEKNGVEIWFEFGQTRSTKLSQYLNNNKTFIIVPNEKTIITVKRGKNFKLIEEYENEKSRMIMREREKDFRWL